MYTTQCVGLHGHVKVSPTDGTVYVPNNNCSGDGAVVVSEDNGITWNIRHVQNATIDTISGNSDPAVGIDNNGRVYFAMAHADSAAAVATSDDHGNTWAALHECDADAAAATARPHHRLQQSERAGDGRQHHHPMLCQRLSRRLARHRYQGNKHLRVFRRRVHHRLGL